MGGGSTEEDGTYSIKITSTPQIFISHICRKQHIEGFDSFTQFESGSLNRRISLNSPRGMSEADTYKVKGEGSKNLSLHIHFNHISLLSN